MNRWEEKKNFSHNVMYVFGSLWQAKKENYNNNQTNFKNKKTKWEKEKMLTSKK